MILAKINKLIEIDDDLKLLKDLKFIKNEIGMIEFIEKKDILPIGKKYIKIGNFELDILVIRKNNKEIVMIDHDSPDFEIGSCATDIRSFLKAISVFICFMDECKKNDKLYNNKTIMEEIAIESSKIAGNKKFLWFYQMMLGI